MITRPTSIKGHGPCWTELELSQHDTFLLSSISTHASSRNPAPPPRPDPGADGTCPRRFCVDCDAASLFTRWTIGALPAFMLAVRVLGEYMVHMVRRVWGTTRDTLGHARINSDLGAFAAEYAKIWYT